MEKSSEKSSKTNHTLLKRKKQKKRTLNQRDRMQYEIGVHQDSTHY